MRKLFLLTSLLISTNSFSDELHNFNELKSAVMTGKTIRVAVDFLKCSSANKGDEPVSIGVFTPNAIHVANDHVAASLTHFTLNDPSFPGKPVYEFVSYTIADDNNLNLTDQVLDAVNYTPLSDKFSFNCKIDSGVKIYD